MMGSSKIGMKLGSVVAWGKQRLQLQVGMFVSQNYLHLFSCAGNLCFSESCFRLKCSAFI